MADGSSWFLCYRFRFQRDRDRPETVIEAPAGFITDLTSAPRALWDILPPWGTYGQAAVIHDWLYWDQGTGRSEADLVMMEAMIALDVERTVRLAIMDALRAFGQNAWDDNARARAVGATRTARVPVTVRRV
jgi:hypothetical protein